MIKTILVPASGSGTDQTVFATALALGRVLDSHLHFLHVHLQPATTALEVPHMEFCQGAAISPALESLRQQGEHLFCRVNEVEIRETPGAVTGVTARFSEEAG